MQRRIDVGGGDAFTLGVKFGEAAEQAVDDGTVHYCDPLLCNLGLSLACDIYHKQAFGSARDRFAGDDPN